MTVQVYQPIPSKTTMMSVAEILPCVNAFALQKLFIYHQSIILCESLPLNDFHVRLVQPLRDHLEDLYRQGAPDLICPVLNQQPDRQ